MYQSINVHQFRQAFIDMDRKDQFSYEGLTALFEFLEEMSEDTGQDFELDVIALCCDFSEMGLDEILSEYPDLFDQDEMVEMDGGELYDYIVDQLNDETMVIPVDDEKIILQAF